MMNIYQMSADSFYDIDSPAFPYKWKRGVNMNIRTLDRELGGIRNAHLPTGVFEMFEL